MENRCRHGPPVPKTATELTQKWRQFVISQVTGSWEHFYFENHRRGDIGGRSLDGAGPFGEATIQHHNIRAVWHIVLVNHSVTRLGALLPGKCWNGDQFDWGHNVELQIIRMDYVLKPSKFQHKPRGASFPKSHTAGLLKVNDRDIHCRNLRRTHQHAAEWNYCSDLLCNMSLCACVCALAKLVCVAIEECSSSFSQSSVWSLRTADTVLGAIVLHGTALRSNVNVQVKRVSLSSEKLYAFFHQRILRCLRGGILYGEAVGMIPPLHTALYDILSHTVYFNRESLLMAF